MITHSPKQTFLLFNKPIAESLQEQRESLWFTVSMTYALAEMAHLGATTEQLLGARNFIAVLQNLWDKGEPAKRLPVQSLKTYDVDDLVTLLRKENKPNDPA